jgi:hypothetical protein
MIRRDKGGRRAMGRSRRQEFMAIPLALKWHK